MKCLKYPNNFLELPDKFSDYAVSKALILPFPYEKTTSYVKGTKKGPSAIISASREVELFDNEIGNIYEVGICTLKELSMDDAPEEMAENTYAHFRKLLRNDKFVITLGGEHSITSGIVKAYKDVYNDLSVLQIDAHADLRENFEGSRYSHACAMRRTMDFSSIVQVGIRSLSEEEDEFIKEKKLSIFWAKEIHDNDNWFGKAISNLSGNVYLTIDLDGFDPSIMPAVGTPEPGGLGYYQVLNFLKEVFKKRNVVGCDVVELCPRDKDINSDFTAARLVYKIIGYKFLNEKINFNKN